MNHVGIRAVYGILAVHVTTPYWETLIAMIGVVTRRANRQLHSKPLLTGEEAFSFDVSPKGRPCWNIRWSRIRVPKVAPMLSTVHGIFSGPDEKQILESSTPSDGRRKKNNLPD
jgi:hypothetical protein